MTVPWPREASMRAELYVVAVSTGVHGSTSPAPDTVSTHSVYVSMTDVH